MSLKHLGLFLFCAVVVAISGWATAKWQADLRAKRELARGEEYRKMIEAAEGRTEFVSATDLMASPSKYDGKRIILAGVWSQGFELSSLGFQGVAQVFAIWVTADWSKIDSPMGDFSNRKKNKEEPKPYQKWGGSYYIVAEGTFHYRRHDKDTLSGYGHMGFSEGYFLIDRLFEWTEKDIPAGPAAPL